MKTQPGVRITEESELVFRRSKFQAQGFKRKKEATKHSVDSLSGRCGQIELGEGRQQQQHFPLLEARNWDRHRAGNVNKKKLQTQGVRREAGVGSKTKHGW